jgi:hypothetical protein
VRREETERRDSELREDVGVEREYCPACRTIFLPGRSCWYSQEDDSSGRPLRPAA